LGEGGGEALVGFAARFERVGGACAAQGECEPAGDERHAGQREPEREQAGRPGLAGAGGGRLGVAGERCRERGDRGELAGRRGGRGRLADGGDGDSGRGGGGRDGEADGRGAERLVGAAFRVEVGVGDGAELVVAGFGGHQDDVFGEGDIEEFSLGRGAFGLRLHNLEIFRDAARREAGDVGPVAGAGEGERPGDGFADRGAFGDDLGFEFKLADGAGEGGRCGLGQRADVEGERLAGDGLLLHLGVLEEPEVGVAGDEVDELGGRGELDLAGGTGAGACAVGDEHAALAADGGLCRFGFGPVFEGQRDAVPVGLRGTKGVEVAAGDGERVGEREDLAGPDGVGRDGEVGIGNRFQGDVDGLALGEAGDEGEGDGLRHGEVDHRDALGAAGDAQREAGDGGQRGVALGLALLKHEGEFGGLADAEGAAVGLPAGGLRRERGGEREKTEEE